MHLIVIILFSFFHFLLHPVHVSITNINLNSELNTAEVSFQFFSDDFINLILAEVRNDIQVADKNELADENIKDVSDYIFSLFAIKINNDEELTFDFQSVKRNEGSIWIYYKGKLPEGEIENITLTNKLMLDKYTDQTNLVIMDLDGIEKGYTFNISNNNINVNY